MSGVFMSRRFLIIFAALSGILLTYFGLQRLQHLYPPQATFSIIPSTGSHNDILDDILNSTLGVRCCVDCRTEDVLTPDSFKRSL